MEVEARLTVWLPATRVAAAMARQACRALALVLSPRRTADLGLMVTELVANSARHATAANNSVTVELLLFDDLLRVEVRDRGAGFEPPPPPAAGALAPSGWGLVLIERLADRWAVEPEPPTRVWFELDRRKADRAARPGAHTP